MDRSRLFAAIERIDRELKTGGHLIIYDFWPEAPCRRSYHHLPEANVYTWKQDYSALFLASGLYQEIHRQALIWDSTEPALHSDSNNRCIISVLEKAGESAYQDQA